LVIYINVLRKLAETVFSYFLLFVVTQMHILEELLASSSFRWTICQL